MADRERQSEATPAIGLAWHRTARCPSGHAAGHPGGAPIEYLGCRQLGVSPRPAGSDTGMPRSPAASGPRSQRVTFRRLTAPLVTFDDGPSESTDELLDLHREYGLRWLRSVGRRWRLAAMVVGDVAR